MSSAATVALLPVREDPRVLDLFLAQLEATGVDAAWFVDDNVDPASSAALATWCRRNEGRVFVGPPREPELPGDRFAHEWPGVRIARVAYMLDELIGAFLTSRFEAALLVGSDVLLPPDMVPLLDGCDRDVVCEVYWSRWAPGAPWMPQVWDHHPYGFRNVDWIVRLRAPGQYRVNGLGACTLVRRRVFEAGARFEALPGLRIPGEDRHFCLRASALGFELWADTTHPPFHVYRAEQLPEARAWVEAGAPASWCAERWLTPAWETELRAMLGRRAA